LLPGDSSDDERQGSFYELEDLGPFCIGST